MSPIHHAPAHIRAIAPYQPGKPISELAREMGLDEADIVKLASNENPLGISPLASAAIRAELDGLALYPDGNGFTLKSAIARKLGVDLDQIVLGNGSNDVLEMAARAYLMPGRSAVFSEHAFAVYPLAVQAVGATGLAAPARDYGHDLAAMLSALRDDTRVVFIANPNNPTGTLLGAGGLHEFLTAVPTNVLVVLDEAYVEFLDPDARAPSVAWLAEFPNLVVTRTFSKAYGLAGLRVGYALARPAVPRDGRTHLRVEHVHRRVRGVDGDGGSGRGLDCRADNRLTAEHWGINCHDLFSGQACVLGSVRSVR